jgi:GNAT superfamily N-acetyltransferase
MVDESTSSTAGRSGGSEVRIELVDREEDFEALFDCAGKAFGEQAKDAIWMAMNPGWDTPEGRLQGAKRMADRWRGAKESGNTLFLKAVLVDLEDGATSIAGVAIWVQASMIEGQGTLPPSDLKESLGVKALYPHDPEEQRYLCQAIGSLHKRRYEVLAEKAKADSPTKATMVLDMCVVDPSAQRRGIATKLVRWGLQEAEKRGNLEATTEASAMGRHVYARCGFKRDEEEIVYVVDEIFEHRDRPSNVFMRTGGPN